MRILIELPTWLGDAVMSTPAIENLVNYYDESEVILIGSFISIEALKNHPRISNTYVTRKKYTSLYKISKKLGQFDIFFSFRSSFRSKFLKLLISSKKKFRFDGNRYQNRHFVEKYNSFINDCLNTDFKAGKLNIKPNLISSVSNSVPVVGINPGASYGDAKRWYPEEFAQVATKLSNQYDILIFGGPDEKNIAEDIEKKLVEKGVLNYQNLAGKTSISDLVNLISSLDLFITSDSGPMHLAASFEVPTIAIFGPTRDNETSQWMNKKSIIVKKNLDCQPCMKRICPLKHHKCMKLIKADDVLNVIDSFN